MAPLLHRSLEPQADPPQWRRGFLIDGEPGGPIKLAQVDRKTFQLTSTITYLGETGLGGAGLSHDVMQRIRTLDPLAAVKTQAELARVETTGPADDDGDDRPFLTDLASVPGPARWFLGRYGEHTPAVLIHDWLIPVPDGLDGMTDALADRYLRFMLRDLEIRWLKRWTMWAAVAMRTRYAAKGRQRMMVLVWALLSLVGMGSFVVGLSSLVAGVPGGATWLLWVAAGLPFVAAGLWERQYGAGLVAALALPCLLPPCLLAVVGYVVYLLIEGAQALLASWFMPRRIDTGTYRPEGF